MTTSNYRLFVALMLPYEVTKIVEEMRSLMGPKYSRNYQPAHVTLIDSISTDRPEEKIDLMKSVVHAYSSFQLRINGVKWFDDPRSKTKKIIHLEIAKHQKMMHLQSHLGSLLTPKSVLPFSPHVTLGRVETVCVKNVRQTLSEVTLPSKFEPIGPVCIMKNGAIGSIQSINLREC